MAPDVQEALFHNIDVHAARRRAAVTYIIGLIEENEAEIREAFLPDVGETESADRVLYENVAAGLRELESRHLSANGGGLYDVPVGHTDERVPAVRLGWAKFYRVYMGEEQPAEGQKVPHVLDLTPTGIVVVNGLRAARGQVSLEQERKNSSWLRG